MSFGLGTRPLAPGKEVFWHGQAQAARKSVRAIALVLRDRHYRTLKPPAGCEIPSQWLAETESRPRSALRGGGKAIDAGALSLPSRTPSRRGASGCSEASASVRSGGPAKASSLRSVQLSLPNSTPKKQGVKRKCASALSEVAPSSSHTAVHVSKPSGRPPARFCSFRPPKPFGKDRLAISTPAVTEKAFSVFSAPPAVHGRGPKAKGGPGSCCQSASVLSLASGRANGFLPVPKKGG